VARGCLYLVNFKPYIQILLLDQNKKEKTNPYLLNQSFLDAKSMSR
jgi:hypothetical protein